MAADMLDGGTELAGSHVVFRYSWKSLSYLGVFVAEWLFDVPLLVTSVLAAFAGNDNAILIPLALVFALHMPVVRWRAKITIDDSKVHVGAIFGSGRTIPRDRITSILQYSGYPGRVVLLDQQNEILGSTPPMWSRRQLMELSKLLQVPYHDRSRLSWKKTKS